MNKINLPELHKPRVVIASTGFAGLSLVKNRVFIFINWVWNYLIYDQSLRLIIRLSKKD